MIQIQRILAEQAIVGILDQACVSDEVCELPRQAWHGRVVQHREAFSWPWTMGECMALIRTR